MENNNNNNNNNNIFNNFKTQVQERNVEYKMGNFFPLEHIAGLTYKTANGHQLEFTELGIRSLRFHDRSINYAKMTDWLRDGDYHLFSNATKNNKKFEGQFIFAIINGKVSGITKHYNQFLDTQIARIIEEAKIEHLVYRTQISEARTAVYIRLFEKEYGEDNKVVSGLVIENGMTGHVSLNFYHFIDFPKMCWEQKIKHVTYRHMSKIKVGVDKLEIAINETKEVELIVKLSNALVNTQTHLIYSETNDKDEILVDQIIGDMDDDSSLLDFLVALSSFANVRGYKATVNKIATKIISAFS